MTWRASRSTPLPRRWRRRLAKIRCAPPGQSRSANRGGMKIDSGDEVGAGWNRPPPKPDGRISRIRLSKRQVALVRDRRGHAEKDARTSTLWPVYSSIGSFVAEELTIARSGFDGLFRVQPLSGHFRQFVLFPLLFHLPLPLCLPSLHGHYPASSLLRRLCHLPGRFFEPLGLERRSSSRIVIPDSRRTNFLPFPLLPPAALLPPRSLSGRCVVCRSCLVLHGSASGS
jgi:hypothetical protein